jgi:NAD+ synthase (glutamine-hydrolysing)
VGRAGAGRARLCGQKRLSRALLGLSGGIDSALVLAIAVDALGADKVRTVMMPSPYTADISWIDARDMASAGRAYDEISIAPEFEAFKAALAPRVCRAAPKTRPKRTCRRASAARC